MVYIFFIVNEKSIFEYSRFWFLGRVSNSHWYRFLHVISNSLPDIEMWCDTLTVCQKNIIFIHFVVEKYIKKRLNIIYFSWFVEYVLFRWKLYVLPSITLYCTCNLYHSSPLHDVYHCWYIHTTEKEIKREREREREKEGEKKRKWERRREKCIINTPKSRWCESIFFCQPLRFYSYATYYQCVCVCQKRL